MDDDLEKSKVQKVQADNNSIAIGEFNISGTVTGNIHIGHTIVQAADSRLRRDLGILLKNVETTWIRGVLEKSVHEAALFELGMELRDEAVDNPWRMVMEKPDQSRGEIPKGRKIKDIFNEANRLLLILGEPGSGKTTTLLQLARDLIAEVDSAFTQPIPVILNLSTWTNKQQPLDEWLIWELNSKYCLPKKDGKRWLKDRRILPLLDGLDEVKAENRAACVEKINSLAKDYGLQGLAVCSRIKDYTNLDVRLAFYRAIYLQPLTPEQVDEYLDQAGDKLANLRATLQEDDVLKGMAQSPLTLSIMSLAYQDISTEDLSNPMIMADEARYQHLFNTYFSRMLSRKGGMQVYQDKQIKKYLSWLARNMQRCSQEVFLIEGLQPSWLMAHYWHWFYFFASRLVSGLLLGLSAGSIFEESIWWLAIIGLAVGLFIGLIDILRCEWIGMRKSPPFWWSVINIVVVFLISGLIVGLISRLGDNRLGNGLNFGIVFGLIFGIRGSRQSREIDIETVEALRWSWRKATMGGLIGGIIGLIFGLCGPLIFGLINGLISWLAWGVTFGLLFGLLGIILNGLRREIMETKSSPNHGIRLSARNAIFGGLIIALSFGLIGELLSDDGLHFGLLLGLMGALWYGGFDIIQHYSLRLILLAQGCTPVDIVRFLDYAVDRIFLQKVGGGYRFIHRLLLEHFAEMYENKL